MQASMDFGVEVEEGGGAGAVVRCVAGWLVAIIRGQSQSKSTRNASQGNTRQYKSDCSERV